MAHEEIGAPQPAGRAQDYLLAAIKTVCVVPEARESQTSFSRYLFRKRHSSMAAVSAQPKNMCTFTTPVRYYLFSTSTVMFVPADMEMFMRPHSFLKSLSAAVRIHTMKCSSPCRHQGLLPGSAAAAERHNCTQTLMNADSTNAACRAARVPSWVWGPIYAVTPRQECNLQCGCATSQAVNVHMMSDLDRAIDGAAPAQIRRRIEVAGWGICILAVDVRLPSNARGIHQHWCSSHQYLSQVQQIHSTSGRCPSRIYNLKCCELLLLHGVNVQKPGNTGRHDTILQRQQ